MSEKIFCGSGRIVPTKYGDMIKISVGKQDVNNIVKYMKDNKVDWCNMVLKEKRDKVEGKPTHYLEIDEWKPTEPKQEPKQTETGLPQSALGGEIGEDQDLPF